MDYGYGRSISVTMIMSSSFVSWPIDCRGGIQLSSFVIAELIAASLNVDLPYFSGPWTHYQCHSGTTIIVTTISVWSRPRPMRLF